MWMEPGHMICSEFKNSLYFNRAGVCLLLAVIIAGCSLNEAPECAGEKRECVYDNNSNGYVQRVCNPQTQQWKMEQICGESGCKDDAYCAAVTDWCDIGEIRCRDDENKIGIVEECKNNKNYELKNTCTNSCAGNECGVCINDEVKCVNEEGKGQNYKCIKGKWERTDVCENGNSCHRDGKTCGSCINGTVACNKNNKIEEADVLATCTDGEIFETECKPPAGNGEMAKGACKSSSECGHVKCADNYCHKEDTQQCVNDKYACGVECKDCTDVVSAGSADISCVSGECVYKCKAGYHSYNRTCDEADDVYNCGAHGNSCYPDFYSKVRCDQGKCVIEGCASNYNLITVNGVTLCLEHLGGDPAAFGLEPCANYFAHFDSHIFCNSPASESCACLLTDQAREPDYCACVSN